MYKTTFGPRIHHVLLIILLFFTISSLKGSEAYGFIITATEVDNRDYFDKIKISNSTFEVAFSHYPKLNSIRNEKRSLSELIDFNSNIEIKHAYSSNLDLELNDNGEITLNKSDLDLSIFDGLGLNIISEIIFSQETFDCSNVGNNTVTITASDIFGRSVSLDLDIRINDSMAPVARAKDITVFLDSAGQIVISPEEIDNGSWDNCSIDLLSIDRSAFNFTNLGSNNITLTVTDIYSNWSTANATVTVQDNEPPTVRTKNISIELDSNGQASIQPLDVDDGSTDNSEIDSYSLDISNFDCSDIGQNTVVLTVTDIESNSASAEALVTVIDNSDPTITAPADIQADTDSSDCNASSLNLGTATTADNCNIASVINDAPTDFPLGQTTVTWTVTDDAANTATDIQIVTITDNTKPTITAPVDVQANTDSNDCNASGVNLGTATTVDNCNVASVVNDAPTDFPLGETTVTWTVTDDAGNSATDTQTVTVTDNIKPIITASADIDATTDSRSCDASLNITPATATDNCSTPAPTGTRSDGLPLNDPYPTGSTIITWNVEDDNGNIAESVDQVITIEDNEVPVLPTVEDILWGCEYTVKAPIALDNCSGEITGTTTDPVTYSTTGVYEITWIFQDEYGNTSQLIQTIEIDELTVELSKTDVLCNGFETGDAATNVTGGVQPYYYSWKDANNAEISTESSISNLPAGNYSVTVKDFNNCEITTQVEIEQPETLSMTTPSSTAVTCFDGNDGSITVGTVTGGTAPYQYSIDNTNFQTETIFNNLSADDYTIFVKDANNCSLQIDITVTEPEVLTGTLSKTDVECFEGTNGIISITNISGGNASYEFSLNDGAWQAAPEFTNLTAGSYKVEIRDDSQTDCEVNLGNITLNEPSAPLEVTATSTRTTSFGSSTGSVTANPTGGTPGYFYEWKNAGASEILTTTKTVNNLPAGDYEVSVRDANGCISETISVTILDAVFAQIDSAAICESDDKQGDDPIRTAYFRVTGFTAQGGDGNYTYSWNFGEGKTATGPGEHAVIYNNPGNKTITLTVKDEGGSGETFTVTRQQYVGLCYEPCGQAQNFQFDVDGIYIGDINGNALDLEDDAVCESGIDMYLFLPVSKSVNVYNPYTEVTFSTSNGLLDDLFEAQEDFGCKDGEEIDEVDDDKKPNKVGDFIRLTINPIEYKCGDNLDIESFYITYTNVSKKDCKSNNNGFCYSTNEPVVVPTPVFVAATPTHVKCFEAETGIIETRGSGGFAPYTFNIKGADEEYFDNNVFNGLAAGNYTVYIKDSRGNKNSTTVTVNEPNAAISVTTSKVDPECFGELGSATTSEISGGTPFFDENGDPYYEILWNDSASQSAVEAESLEPGEYTVTVTDANGCQAISNVTIIEPAELTDPIAGENQELGCGSLSTILNANTPESGIGKWTIDTSLSPTGGQFTDDTNPATTFTGSQGTYTLIWTIANEDGSCARFDTVEISIVGECSKLDFDGVDDHITFNDSYGLTSGSFSLEIWVKPESTTGVQTLISKKDKASSSTGYELIINNGSPSFKWNGKTLSTGNKIGTDRWYHIAVIYNGTARLYVDGIDVGNASGSNPTTTTAPFLLGALYDSTSPNSPKNFYSGWMEELRVWNIALTKEQLQFMMNQKLSQNGTLTKGQVLPINVPGNLPWANLKGYYSLDPSETLNGLTLDISSSPVNGEMRNIITDQKLSAPLPYISEATGSWRERSTWDTNIGNEQEKWWDVPNGIGVNGDRINWNIVETSHNINSSAQDIYVLGLLSKTQELKIDGNVDNQSGQGLTVTKYLKLDGTINLEGNSQLVQTTGSILDETSTGYIDIDQQGTANSFNYNYWTSPVSLISSANNSGYTIDSVLMDGTNPDDPQSLSFNYQFHWADGNYSGNKRISSYWLYTFKGTANDYSEWHQFGESEALEAGIGFSMKGTTGYVPVSNRQNYTFRGKPNNGDIKVSIGASDQNLLTGNPYPSAIDALEFIGDNLGGFNGSLYFWDHFGAVNSHYLEEYVGGYAVYNLSGGIASASSVDSRINPTGEKSAKAPPGRYIPVGQAFFISSTGVSSPKEITYKNKYRAFVPESTDDSQFHSQEKVNPKKEQEQYKKDSRYKIRLKFESPKGYHRQILVTADVNSSSGFDLGYDAPLFENNVEDMYWMIEETEFVIQAVPDFNLNQVLPIGLKISEAGEYTIKLDSLENIKSEFNIYLKDKLNDTYFDLVKDNYTTTAEEVGSFNERFEIVFQKPVTEEPIKENPDLIDSPILDLSYLRDTDEIAVLNPDLMNVDFVELYSISGQLIKTFKEVPTERAILLSINQKLSSAVYIVRIYSGENTYSRKVIITK